MEIARYWRLEPIRYKLSGSNCPECGIKHFPPRDICPDCGHKKNTQPALEPKLQKAPLTT